jgi:hypothetical protein
LERRLACVYFDTSDAFGCLTCDEDEQQQQRVIKKRRQLRSLMEVEDSTMMGIASWPVDVPNPVEGKLLFRTIIVQDPSLEYTHHILIISLHLLFLSTLLLQKFAQTIPSLVAVSLMVNSPHIFPLS